METIAVDYEPEHRRLNGCVDAFSCEPSCHNVGIDFIWTYFDLFTP